LLRIIAIAILVYVAIRFALRLLGLGASRHKKRYSRPNQKNQRSENKQRKEKHRQGDVIIEYNKPPKKKPRLDADDVEFEVIE